MHPKVPVEQRQRLLLFNLRTDADDHILGFTTEWINRLAPYYQQIDVLTTHAGRIAVADNVTVYSVGREKGAGRLQMTRNFYSILSSLLTSQRYDACFAHMQPLFAALGAPLLTLRGVHVTTWYTHRQRTRQLELATRLSYRVVSAVESSFPISTAKLRPLGHGINTKFYRPAPQPIKHIPPRIVQVARLTDIKHQHILLEAAQNLDCEIVFVGDIPDGFDDAYKQRLLRMVDDLNMREKVIFAGAQTPEQVVTWYQGAALAINLSPRGLFDKGALEGMAVGLPTIVSNDAFTPLLGTHAEKLLIPAPDDVAALRDRLTYLLSITSGQRRVIGEALRREVIQQHSLPELIKRLIGVLHTGEI